MTRSTSTELAGACREVQGARPISAESVSIEVALGSGQRVNLLSLVLRLRCCVGLRMHVLGPVETALLQLHLMIDVAA